MVGTLIEGRPAATRTVEIEPRALAALHAARPRPEFWLLFAAFPLIGFTAGLIITHIMPVLTDAGMSLENAVAVVALFGPMQVASRLGMIRLARRVRPLAMATISFSRVIAAVLFF